MQDYRNLIYLGPGMRPSLDELIMLAERVWLVDASEAVVENLKRQAGGCVNINVIQGLVDKEQRISTFSEYNLAWVNGPVAPDEKTLRLYPGLRCLSTQQQRTIDIKQLISDCLGQSALIDVGEEKNLLVIDLGNQADMLLSELHSSGQLAAFSAVVIVPPFRGGAEVNIPSSLHDSLIPASEIPIGLPGSSQAFTRHPLVKQLQDFKKVCIELRKQVEQEKAELNKALEEQKELLLEKEQSVFECEVIKQQFIEQSKTLEQIRASKAAAEETYCSQKDFVKNTCNIRRSEKFGLINDAVEAIGKVHEKRQRCKIVVGSMPRSGSTWLFNCVKRVASFKGLPVYSDWIEDYNPNDDAKIHIIKAHDPDIVLEYINNVDVIVSSRRDIRCVAASLNRMKWAKQGESFFAQLDWIVNKVHHYWYRHTSLEVEYNDLLVNPVNVIENVSHLLGVHLTSSQAEKISRDLIELESPPKYDRSTQLHPYHRDKESMHYSEILSREQISLINSMFHDWLAEFRYFEVENKT